MRLLSVSETKKFSAPFTEIRFGLFRVALVAGPLSPPNPAVVPLPATVVMIWVVALISRTRLFWVSETNKLSWASMSRPRGQFRMALTAGPPSPEIFSAEPGTHKAAFPLGPFPATVEIFLVVTSILRTRLSCASTKNIFPLESTTIPRGSLRLASVAGPPSPQGNGVGLPHCAPVPAMVVIVPSTTCRIRWSPESATSRVPEGSTVTVRGTEMEALVAGPLSPHVSCGCGHGIPLPTSVEMTWVVAFTSRIRLFDVSTIYKLPCTSSAGLRGSYKLALVAGPPSPTNPFPTAVEICPLPGVYRRMRLF